MGNRGNERPGRAAWAVVTLAGVTLAVGAMVMVVDSLVRPTIVARERARQAEAFESLLAGVPHDNDVLADVTWVRDPELLGTTEPVPVHRVRRAGRPVALIVEPVAPDGYVGAITLRIAVDVDGRVLGTRVLRHHETPGLGGRIDDASSNWMAGFKGRSLASPTADRWKVRKDGGDFDQFTGATVTPRAVVRAIAACLQYVEQHRDELYAAPARMTP